MSADIGDTWFRGEFAGTSYAYYRELKVVRVTAKGVWIVDLYLWKSRNREWTVEEIKEEKDRGLVKWVPFDGKWASATEEEAAARLLARTRSYVKHSERRLDEAKERLHTLVKDGGGPVRIGKNSLQPFARRLW